MPRREHLDLRNGIILAFLAIIVVLYSKLLHQNLALISSIPFTPNKPPTSGHVTTTSPPPYETETTHYDGLLKYTRTTPNTNPNLLILLLTKDDTSWGHDVDAPPRTFDDFLTMLKDTKLDLSSTSLALWTSSPEQYALFRTATAKLPLARLSVFLGKSIHPSLPTIIKSTFPTSLLVGYPSASNFSDLVTPSHAAKIFSTVPARQQKR
jgi:hypothetical protein